jgi:hypothetical protein
MLLCGGADDSVVIWLNAQLMQGYWAQHAAASAPISVLDLESATSADDSYAALKNGFTLAKDLVAANAAAFVLDPDGHNIEAVRRHR